MRGEARCFILPRCLTFCTGGGATMLVALGSNVSGVGWVLESCCCRCAAHPWLVGARWLLGATSTAFCLCGSGRLRAMFRLDCVRA